MRRIVGHADGEQDAPLLHRLVILDARPGEIGIRKDELFSVQRAKARRLQADILHGSHLLARDDKVADFKWAVEKNREETKNIAEERLRGKGDGDSADTDAAISELILIPTFSRNSMTATIQMTIFNKPESVFIASPYLRPSAYFPCIY
jgi:hypothetical protein